MPSAARSLALRREGHLEHKANPEDYHNDYK
jgi:hypothetical protein